MVARGPAAGDGRYRFILWLDGAGLPLTASLDYYEYGPGSGVTATLVRAGEPFDDATGLLDALMHAIERGSQGRLELP